MIKDLKEWHINQNRLCYAALTNITKISVAQHNEDLSLGHTDSAMHSFYCLKQLSSTCKFSMYGPCILWHLHLNKYPHDCSRLSHTPTSPAFSNLLLLIVSEHEVFFLRKQLHMGLLRWIQMYLLIFTYRGKQWKLCQQGLFWVPGRHGTHKVTIVIKEKIEYTIHGLSNGVRDG